MAGCDPMLVVAALIKERDDAVAEIARKEDSLNQVVEACIQACPEQSQWKCESPEVFVRHLLSLRDAEIIKLKEERAIHLGSIAEHSRQLAAARAAINGERGRADSYRESHKPTSGCVDRIYAGGVLGPIQIDNRCGLCKAHDKLRAAEANGAKVLSTFGKIEGTYTVDIDIRHAEAKVLRDLAKTVGMAHSNINGETVYLAEWLDQQAEIIEKKGS